MYAGTEETPVQLCFHHCHRLPHVNQDESSGKDRKLGERLGDPLWKPPSPPADHLDDPTPLTSASCTLSLRVFLEGFREPMKWFKCSEVFEYPSKYLSAIKILWKHCETLAVIWVLLPFLSNWRIPGFDCLLSLWIRPISFFLCAEDPPKHLGLRAGRRSPEQAAARPISAIFGLASAFCEMVPALVLQRKVSEMQKWAIKD